MEFKGNERYMVCGRYIDADDKRVVLGYSLKCSNPEKSGKYTPDVLGYLCGRGVVTNCTAGISGMGLVFHGKGIELSSLPVKYVKNNRRTTKTDKEKGESSEGKNSRGSVGISTLKYAADIFAGIYTPLVYAGFLLNNVYGFESTDGYGHVTSEVHFGFKFNVSKKWDNLVEIVVKQGSNGGINVGIIEAKRNNIDSSSYRLGDRWFDSMRVNDVVDGIKEFIRTMSINLDKEDDYMMVYGKYLKDLALSGIRTDSMLLDLALTFSNRVSQVYSKFNIESIRMSEINNHKESELNMIFVVGNRSEESKYRFKFTSTMVEFKTEGLCDIRMYLKLPTNPNECLAYSSGAISNKMFSTDYIANNMLRSIILVPDK